VLLNKNRCCFSLQRKFWHTRTYDHYTENVATVFLTIGS
jgi:hypothetical protein